MKEKWVQAYLDVAGIFAQLSSATRLNVGAVIVKDNRIISIGYNGTPAGWDNNCEYVDDQGNLKTKSEVIHAEANAIAKLARVGEAGEGSTLFCTHAPCIECAKLIHGAGVTSVYYRRSYRSNDGIEFLEKCGIETQQKYERYAV